MGTHTSAATREEIDPKSTARRHAAARQQKLGTAWVQDASRRIQRAALDAPEFKAAKGVAVYLALPKEPQTAAILDACWSSGKRVAAPAFQEKLGRYELAWLDKGEPTRAGKFDIVEPVNPRWVQAGELQIIFVPCMAFDPYGRRLGHGGGHFDRMLGRHRCLKICLAFEGQRLAAVPTEPHDIAVDLIITEQQVYDARLSNA